MKNSIREVMLPCAAAVALLTSLGVGRVEAQDDAPAVEPIAAVAATVPARSTTVNATSTASEPTRASAVQQETGDTGQRCRRIERIGKTVITRCDRP